MNNAALRDFVQQRTSHRVLLNARKEEMRRIKEEINFSRFSRGLRNAYYIVKNVFLIGCGVMLIPIAVAFFVDADGTYTFFFGQPSSETVYPLGVFSFLCFVLALAFLYLAWLTRNLHKRNQLILKTEEQTLELIASYEALIESLEVETRQLEEIVN